MLGGALRAKMGQLKPSQNLGFIEEVVFCKRYENQKVTQFC
jgi:hypothetical protein